MKKTMFITSVIMVVVMAIALTTSSLAWFTADSAATVSSNPFTITAKSHASTGLYIARDTSNFSVNNITLADATSSNEYWPMVPMCANDSAELTTLEKLSDNSATAAELAAANALVEAAIIGEKFIGNQTRAVGNITNWQGSAYKTYFFKDETIYVANAGTTATAVTASVAFTDVPSGSGALYVAVLAATTSGWEIIALESSLTDAAATSITIGKTEAKFATGLPQSEALILSYNPAAANVDTETTPTKLVKAQTTETLAGATSGAAWGGYKQFKVLAWFEGQELNNNNSGAATSAKFTVSFSTPSNS